jgi:hypothetical protein
MLQHAADWVDDDEPGVEAAAAVGMVLDVESPGWGDHVLDAEDVIDPVVPDVAPGAALGLTPAMLTVLDRIASGRTAWADREGMGDPDASVVTALVSVGWLERWRVEKDDLYTLTPSAAVRLRVELLEEGARDLPRWGKLTLMKGDLDEDGIDRRPPSPLPGWADLPSPDRFIRMSRYNAAPNWPEGLDVVDPTPGPLDLAIAAEELAMRVDEVPTYDPVRDETRIETVSSPLAFPNWGVDRVKVDRRIGKAKGKGRSKVKRSTPR